MGKEEEKMQMGEMEGLRGRRGACPSGWLVLRRILDHSYQMDVRGFQATEGMERSRSNRKATASPRCPSSMQMAETQPLSHITSPQGSEAPLHLLQGSGSRSVFPHLQVWSQGCCTLTCKVSGQQRPRWWLSPPHSLTLPLQAQLSAVMGSRPELCNKEA